MNIVEFMFKHVICRVWMDIDRFFLRTSSWFMPQSWWVMAITDNHIKVGFLGMQLTAIEEFINITYA